MLVIEIIQFHRLCSISRSLTLQFSRRIKRLQLFCYNFVCVVIVSVLRLFLLVIPLNTSYFRDFAYSYIRCLFHFQCFISVSFHNLLLPFHENIDLVTSSGFLCLTIYLLPLVFNDRSHWVFCCSLFCYCLLYTSRCV